MSKELLLVIDRVANEKEISKEIFFLAMEEALASATSKKLGTDAQVIVKIDRYTGEYNIFRKWIIVDENYIIKNYDRELYIDIAKEKGYKVVLGEIFLEPIPSLNFGRISAMTAKQIIMKKVREEERRLMAIKFRDKIHKICYGEIKLISREFMIVDFGNDAEGILYKKDLLPNEKYRLNDKLKVCILKIDITNKGHQIILTRSHKIMLKALLELEVPEIGEELVDIVNIARDPGLHSKVAVKSNDKRIDPVGACIGMRGSRIQAISNELKGERIDIILWDDSPAQYVINALAPSEIISIIQDEDSRSMQVGVKEEYLSQTIGKNGHNVRLATILTTWSIKVIAEAYAKKMKEKESDNLAKFFINNIDVDESIAKSLVNKGLTTLEELAYIDNEELLNIKGFDDHLVKELQDRAKTEMLAQALTKSKPNKDTILDIKGITKDSMTILAKNKILTVEDLAALSIDDLCDIILIDKNKAAEIIMSAREPWFKSI